MSEVSTRIAKNISILMVSQLATWALSLLLMVFLPRYLGPATVGVYYLAISVWTIIGMFVTFGTDVLLMKEVSRDTENLSKLFSTILLVRLLLFVVGFAIAMAALPALQYPGETVLIIGLTGFSFLVWQFVDVCQASLQGLERMEYIAYGTIANKLVSTLGSIALLVAGWGIYAVVLMLLVAGLVNLLIQFVYLNRLHRLPFQFRFAEAVYSLRAGFPYLMSRIFLVVYMQIDVIIISLFVSSEAVGWYGTADQLFGSLLFIPTVFVSALFPVFARLHKTDTGALAKLMSKSIDIMLLCSIPIGLGMILLADPAIQLLFGANYAGSAPVLAVLGIVLILTYQNTLLGQFLISIDRQNSWTLVMAVAAVATIPLDMVLIPWCQSVFGNGAIGGALAFVVTELAMMVAGLLLLPRGILNNATLWTSVRILIAGAGMAATVLQFQSIFTGITLISVSIVVGAGVYGGLILLLRVLPREDYVLFGRFVNGFLSRFKRNNVEAALP